MSFQAPFSRILCPPFGPGLAPAAAAGYVIYDTFTDANNTILPAHTPEISPAPWTLLYGGNHKISSNRAVSDLGLDWNNIASGVSNLVLTATVNYQNAAVELTARVSDANNGWWYTFYNNRLSIYQLIGGGAYERAYVDGAVPGTVYDCTFTLNGTSIIATAVAGATTLTCNYTSSFNLTATGVGIRSAWWDGYVDDFAVVAL